MSQLGDAQMSEDFGSEVILRMLIAIQKYRFRGPPFSAWIFRIARNKLIDLLRRDNRSPRVGLTESLASPNLAPDTMIERAMERGEIRQALQHLPNEQAEVIALRFFQELDTASVASILGRSQSAVKALQHRAPKSLRTIVAPEVPTTSGAAPLPRRHKRGRSPLW